jgi:hypothetical protein
MVQLDYYDTTRRSPTTIKWQPLPAAGQSLVLTRRNDYVLKFD